MSYLNLRFWLVSLCGLLITQVTLANNQFLTVSVKPLSNVLIDSKQSSPATVVSLNTSTVSSEITGRAVKVYAETGDQVKAKQRLVALDCRSYELAKKQAEASLRVSLAQLNLTQKQLQRNQQLVSKGTIPKELYENSLAAQQTSIADIEFKKAQIETTDLAINRCIIRAPFSAQVINRIVQRGQLLLPGTQLFELMQNNLMEIKTDLSPADVITLGQRSLVEFVTANQRYKVKVRSIIQRVNENTRTQEVRLSLDKNVTIPEGLAGRIEWSSLQLKIPPEYILRNNGKLGIMLAENTAEGTAKATFRELIDAIEGQPSETDLSPNTLIIDKNRYRVADGELINIQK